MELTNKDSPSDQAKIKMNFNAKDFVKNNKKIVSAGVIVIGKFGDMFKLKLGDTISQNMVLWPNNVESR